MTEQEYREALHRIKVKAERFLNKLFRGLKEAERHYPYWVRQGYFKSEFVGLCVNFKTEYWIEKY